MEATAPALSPMPVEPVAAPAAPAPAPAAPVAPTPTPAAGTATSVTQVRYTSDRIAAIAVGIFFALAAVSFFGLLAVSSVYVIPAIACTIVAIACFASAFDDGVRYTNASTVHVPVHSYSRTVVVDPDPYYVATPSVVVAPAPLVLGGPVVRRPWFSSGPRLGGFRPSGVVRSAPMGGRVHHMGGMGGMRAGAGVRMGHRMR